MDTGEALLEEPAQYTKFEEIYWKYRGLMLFRAREILKDDFLAEDAVSEAFLKISKNIHKIHTVDSSETKHFILIITERAAIDLYHRKNKHTAISFEEMTEEPVYDAHQELSPLGAAIVQLPANYREVLLLKFSDGYNNREIVAMLGYSVSKVEKLISRGKKKLEHILEKEGKE